MLRKKLPLIDNNHGAETRNKINLAIQTINDRGLEILSDSAFLEWLFENGIKHRAEVQSFADLPNSDSLNTVRGVFDDNKIYIKKENGWVPFQTIDISKINEVELKADNFGLSAVNFGVTGDGETDDTTALQSLVDSAGEKAIQLKTDGVYVISKTIKLKDVTTIIGNGATILLKENVDGFLVPKNAVVKDIKFMSGITGYSKIMYRLDDKSGYNVASRGYIESADFIGDPSCLGVGMGAYDENTRGVVTYHRGHNLSFNSFAKGISFENDYGTSWYNGNNYTNITMYHCRVFIVGKGVFDGNRFNGVQLQPSGITEIGVRCNGNNNKFDVTSWDYDAYPDATAYDFSGGYYNEINTNGTNINHNKIKAHLSNKLNGSTIEGVVIPKVNSDSTSITNSYGTTLDSLVNYNGNQDDILTMIDKKATITKNGEAINMANAFRINRAYHEFDMVANEEIEIRIIPDANLNYIDLFGVIFTGFKPDKLTLLSERSTGTIHSEVFDNLQNVYAYTNNIVGSSTRWIGMKFSVNSARKVRISRVFASSRYMTPTSFLKTDGGDVYGDVNLKEGRLTLNSPDGSQFRLNVANDGTLTTTKLNQ